LSQLPKNIDTLVCLRYSYEIPSNEIEILCGLRKKAAFPFQYSLLIRPDIVRCRRLKLSTFKSLNRKEEMKKKLDQQQQSHACHNNWNIVLKKYQLHATANNSLLILSFSFV